MKEEIATAAAKAAPPAAVTGAHFIFGLSLNDWVAIATLIYIVLQVVLLIVNQMKAQK